MSDYLSEISTLCDSIITLSEDFRKKFNIFPNTIFMSNNIYWKILKINQDYRDPGAEITPERKILGLAIKILGSEEGDNEMYVGIVEG